MSKKKTNNLQEKGNLFLKLSYLCAHNFTKQECRILNTIKDAIAHV